MHAPTAACMPIASAAHSMSSPWLKAWTHTCQQAVCWTWAELLPGHMHHMAWAAQQTVCAVQGSCLLVIAPWAPGLTRSCDVAAPAWGGSARARMPTVYSMIDIAWGGSARAGMPTVYDMIVWGVLHDRLGWLCPGQDAQAEQQQTRGGAAKAASSSLPQRHWPAFQQVLHG